MSIKSERDLERTIEGLRKVPMSGGGTNKGDVKGEHYLIEEKTSVRSVSVSTKMLDKAVGEARREFREPLLVLNVGEHQLICFWR